MKVSVSSYSFSGVIARGEMTQFDCPAKAKEMGFDAVEFVELMPRKEETPEEYAKSLRKECERVGIPVSSFTFSADFLTGSGGDLEQEIQRVKEAIDLAQLLGAPLVRHDATRGGARSFDLELDRIARGCREVTEYAASKGIRTTVENHGMFCQDSDRVERLFNAVNHPNFGLLVDMGNFLCADEDPAIAVSRVAPYAFYAHAKDFHKKSAQEPDPGEGFFRTRGGNYLRGAIIGHGVVPVKQCLSILRLAGYDGTVAIEFEGMEYPLDGIRIGLANLRRYIKEVEEQVR